eukprot:TRINITY_DN1698_c0_g1_i2.p2 TRINITY_DN1698_c0_g1~~TRINITY_DN1698_c0_g1_i2.p2  ORF type:complete len:218 (+),score=59.85 TRINITY_DN1698_c0_g1_i2:1128-1781(+)
MHDGIKIGKMELLDDQMMRAVNIYEDSNFEEKHTLLIEVSGNNMDHLRDEMEGIRNIANLNNGGIFQYAETEEEQEELWRARKQSLWAAPSLKENSQVMVTDACVPLSNLGVCLEETMQDIKNLGQIAPLVAHAGDGNFHLFILVDPDNMEKSEELNDRLVRRAIRLEGTCTGEHGVGVGKKKYLNLELGDNSVELMEKLKKSLDPNNILNPGKIVN